MDDNAKIRRAQVGLVTSGYGLIMFGAWNIVKMIMFMLLAPDYIVKIMGIVEADRVTLRITEIMLVLILLVIVQVRFYVGRCAIAVGKGHRKGKKYLIFAVWILLVSVLSFGAYDADTQYNRIDYVFSMLINLLDVYLLARILYLSYLIRKNEGKEQN